MEPALQQGDYILTKRFDMDLGILDAFLLTSSTDELTNKENTNDSAITFDPCYQSSFFCFNFPPRIRKGDVAVFKSPIDFPAKLCVKRVICEAAPNKGLNQYNNYLSRTRRSPRAASTGSMPPCTIWVEGDNQKLSDDSNQFGPVSKKLVVGRAVRIIWPPSRWASCIGTDKSSSSNK